MAKTRLPVQGVFESSYTALLTAELEDRFSQLGPRRLCNEELRNINSAPGVYTLFYKGQPVYVGKADRSLSGRLGKHLRKLKGRTRIDLSKVEFTCLACTPSEVPLHEKILIGNRVAKGMADWNNGGFGSNDPGSTRDKTKFEADHFDSQFPIDLRIEVEGITPGTQSVMSLLAQMKENLPYNLRFETTRPVEKRELVDTLVSLEDHVHCAAELLHIVIAALPEGWQATALPGYVIVYREVAEYASAIHVWTKRESGDVFDLELVPSPSAGEGSVVGKQQAVARRQQDLLQLPLAM